MASAVDRHRGPAFAGPPAGLDALGIARAAAPRSAPPAILEACSDLDSSDDDHGAASPPPRPPAVMSPPYWVVSSAAPRRNTSSLSIDWGRPAGAITLRDNDTGEHSDRNDACWVKSVDVVDYTVVNGSATNIGAFVLWNVRVETLNRSYVTVRKRYSEFDELRAQLMLSFPSFGAAVPELPPKSIISRFRPTFLEKRRAGLQYFLNCIMLNPEFSGSPVLRAFLFL